LKLLSRLVSSVFPIAAVSIWIAISPPAQAQTGRVYTSDDYNRAANLLNAVTISLVDHAVKDATFIGGDRFWYLDNENGLATLMVADAARRTKAAAYDPLRMATALQAAGLEEKDAKRIHPDEFDLLEDGRSARITIDGTRYKCALGAEYRCSLELAGPAGTPKPSLSDASLADFSPDGRRAVFIRDWNLWVRDIATGAEKQLTLNPKPVWMVEIQTTSHQPSGRDVNPDLQRTFEMFWDHEYEAWTAERKPKMISKEDIERVSLGGINHLGTHNFVFLGRAA